MKSFILVLLFVIGLPFSAQAASGEKPHEQSWHFDGITGTYDRAALQRGLQVYKQVCSACHSMEKLSYRNLSALGYTEGEVKAIAAEYSVMDGPDDEGEMYERPARPSDQFVSPFPNKAAAKYANNGAFPPDMSLIAKARYNGPDYIYALMTGYEEAPEGTSLLSGQYWNKYMPGHVIAMAPPLSDGMIAYADGSPETVSQYSKDVAEFLKWAADPHMEQRKRTGIMALLFLFVFTGVMYATKKKVWKNVYK